jgi:hypothetical protein
LAILAELSWAAQSASAGPLFSSPFLAFRTSQKPSAMATADVNGDGFVDVIAIGPGSCDVLLGAGDGTVRERRSFSTGAGGDSPLDLVIADFDRDGRPDFAVTYYWTNRILVFRGDGQGGFSLISTIRVGHGPYSLAVGDLNGDSIPDLVTASDSTSTVTVLPGLGDGTFAPGLEVVTVDNPRAVAIGDVNGDGAPDVVTSNETNSISVLLGDGTGALVRTANYATSSVWGVALADLDGDGRLDVATSESDMLCVRLGNGDGTFRPSTSYPAKGIAYRIRVADLDGDGILDLAQAQANGYFVSVLFGDGRGGFSPRADYYGGELTFQSDVSDFDRDGRPDLFVLDEAGAGMVAVLPGAGGRRFGGGNLLPAAYGCASLAIGDLNADGHPDLVVGCYGGRSTGVLLGLPGGDFGPWTNSPEGGLGIELSDVDGDGRVDAVTANDSALFVLPGRGDGTFGPPVATKAPATTKHFAVADMNLDGKPDVVMLSGGAPVCSVTVMRGRGDWTFERGPTVAASLYAEAIAAGDLDGNGFPDVVVGHGSNRKYSVLLGTGDGSLGPSHEVAVGVGIEFILICDVNGDGRADLVTPGCLFLGNGDGTFGSGQFFPCGAYPYWVTAADIDGDGLIDLVTANSSDGTVTVSRGRGDGTFAAGSDFGSGQGAYAVGIADLNGDGRPDLAVANYWSNQLSVLLNTGGQALAGVARELLRPGDVRVVLSPNPATSGVRIGFRLPSRSDGTVRVYDIAGRLVSKLKGGTLAAGPHDVYWDLRNARGERVASGIYLVDVHAGGSRTTVRLAVLR